jgi:hypothetical protein
MSSNFNLVDTKSWSLNGKCFILVSNRRTNDIGKIELQNLITRYDLYDAWWKLHSNKKRYSFQRGKSKLRIDFILCMLIVYQSCQKN